MDISVEIERDGKNIIYHDFSWDKLFDRISKKKTKKQKQKIIPVSSFIHQHNPWSKYRIFSLDFYLNLLFNFKKKCEKAVVIKTI